MWKLANQGSTFVGGSSDQMLLFPTSTKGPMKERHFSYVMLVWQSTLATRNLALENARHMLYESCLNHRRPLGNHQVLSNINRKQQTPKSSGRTNTSIPQL